MEDPKYHIHMNKEQAEQIKDSFPILILLWSGTLVLQWWKPDFYWNDNFFIKLLILILGEYLTDVLCYIGTFLLLVGLILLRQEAEKIFSQDP